jgi:hypothetical protein
MVLIVLGLVLATSLTWAAANKPGRSADLERWGGALLVVSLAALGFALSSFR